MAVAIETITTMILISIRPFDVKKIAGLVAAMICLSTVSGFAQSLLLSVPSTPYDHQMARIQPVLFSKPAAHNSNVSLTVVNQWIQDLRGIPYGFSSEWKLPSEVEHASTADCKGKAVALYERMHENGATNVRLVIGKRSWTRRKTHAWLEWTTENGTYVLDPTINWAACRTEKVGNRAYIPFYAYAGTKKYRSAYSTSLFAKN
jgi:predicted transglutaminase-like cysteine proteinase